MDRPKRSRRPFFAMLLALATAALLTATASAAWPSSYAPIAQGRFHGRSWQLGATGHGRQRCFQLVLRRGPALSRAENCGPAREPSVDWKRNAGVSERDGSASVELEVTSTRVRLLKLRVDHIVRVHHFRIRRGSSWVTLPTRRLGAIQALRAHLEPDFRYAVVRELGEICISRFVALDRGGERVESGSMPCEF